MRTSFNTGLRNMTAINRVVGNDMRFDMMAGKLAENCRESYLIWYSSRWVLAEQ